MSLISPVSRARVQRLSRTFHEVLADTGSWRQSVTHMLRFGGKKLVPLARYTLFTLVRLFVLKRVRHGNLRCTSSVPVIGIRILGGLGDYIVIARFLRDLAAAIGPSQFDLYSNKPKLAAWIFASLPGIRHNFDEATFRPAQAGYTFSSQISQFLLIEEHWIRPDNLRRHRDLQRIVSLVNAFRPVIEPIIAEHPRLDSFLAQKAIFANRSRHDYLHFIAGLEYGGDELDLAATDAIKQTHGLHRRRYVTVHNGYDPNMVVSRRRATKCYPHFGQVINRLRDVHADVVFVQVGIHTSDLIPEADVNLISQTSLPEVAGLIRGALFHLDNEGGLVHLARAVGTASCVVFGPTSSRYLGYPANSNIDPSFCGGCWWVTETWMNHCPRGFESARCMTEQPAAAVAEAAERLLLTLEHGSDDLALERTNIVCLDASQMTNCLSGHSGASVL